MSTKLIGVVLIVLGIVMIVWTGFTYTKKEKVIDHAHRKP